MAYTITQLYSFINEVTKGIVGLQKIKVVDTESFVSLGQAVLATDTDVNAFYSALAARIGRTAFLSRALELNDDIERDPLDFGAALQKISISSIARTVSNDSWKTTGGNLAYTQDDTKIFATGCFQSLHGSRSAVSRRETRGRTAILVISEKI